MPKYRKKPVVVEAVRFDPSDGQWDEWGQPYGVMGDGRPGAITGYLIYIYWEDADYSFNDTPIAPGDWIVLGLWGRVTEVLKPDIFAATYEEVNE